MIAIKNITSKLILVFIVFLPWSPFLMKRIDIWHAQGHFAQAGILVLFCCSLIFVPRRKLTRNIPLSLMLFWIGFNMITYQFQAIQMNRYNNGGSFLSFFNFLCLVLFYIVCVQHLNREDIYKILKWFSCSVFVMLVYCVLQEFRLDPFFRVINDLPYKAIKPAVVGIIGNPTHLSGYLGMCLPVFFGKKWFNYLSIILVWVILLFFTNFGNETATVAVSGIVVGICTTTYYLWKTNRKLLWKFLIVIAILVSIVVLKSERNLFNLEGRDGYWSLYLKLSQAHPLKGTGLGAVNVIANQQTDRWLKMVRHLHNEYLHFYFELGLIGLMIILYSIIDFFRVKLKEDDTTIKLKSLFLGFLISCLFTFPAHLWVVSTLAFFAYAGIYALKGEI